jgi:hypothetical protein
MSCDPPLYHPRATDFFAGYHESVPSRLGWQCPGCGMCYAPTMLVCTHCKPCELATTSTAPNRK